MTRAEEAISLDRIVGRLEGVVQGLVEQVSALVNSVEADRREHWAVTNGLVQDMATTRTANESIAGAAKSAREAVLAEAVAAAARVAREATVGADAKAARDAVIADAVTAAAEAARKTIAVEAGDRRGQRHWAIERFLQALPLLAAAAGYLLAKGGT